MGCSSSKADMPPFKPTKPPRCDSAHSAHGFNVFNVVASRDDRFDPDKLEDPVSSWNLNSVPEGYPRDKLLPPDRKLHEKHLKRLNQFLKSLEDAPIKLGERVQEKRRIREDAADAADAAAAADAADAEWEGMPEISL